MTISAPPARKRTASSGISRLPFSLKVLLENLLRYEDGRSVTDDDIEAMAPWLEATRARRARSASGPARVLMQDFTGVPAVVDLAAMRDAMRRSAATRDKINPLVAGRPRHRPLGDGRQLRHAEAFASNVETNIERNGERYRFLRWGQQRLQQLPRGAARHRHLPPGQPRISRRRRCGRKRRTARPALAYPDTLVGTDSHTTMVNGLAVLGWGVGGIEAEAAMLGQPISMLIPEVIGFRSPANSRRA